MSSTPPPTLLTLPLDILHLLLPYLDPLSLLNLTSTCRALHNPSLSTSVAYWTSRLHHDFRLPNLPPIPRSGSSSRKLYSRLTRQTQIYTWGDNEHDCLGQAREDLNFEGAELDDPDVPAPRRYPPRRSDRFVSWPSPLLHYSSTSSPGSTTIDIQCGGWCTAYLTSLGGIYITGIVDGTLETIYTLGSRAARIPTPLTFPVGFRHPHSSGKYDSRTAIKLWSVGRRHVLGVADSGKLWSWGSWEHAGVEVKLLGYDVWEEGRGYGGRIRKIVAGWDKSGVLIDGVGIVLFEPVMLESGDIGLADAVIVIETEIVPGTGGKERYGGMGEVKNFVILENVVVWCTSTGKVFAACVVWVDTMHRIEEAVELPLSVLGGKGGEAPDSADGEFVTDVQGSFRSFAVLVKSGAVLTGHATTLLPFLRAQTQRQKEQTSKHVFRRIPALQHRGVVSVAFGDYHFHALHSSGHITSYGTEPQGCGAFGLGGKGRPEGRLRGIQYSSVGRDSRLVPHAYIEGRRVWFEVEKRDWVQFLTSGGVDPQEAAERMRMAIGSPGDDAQGELSEWIEQEGRDWEGKYGLRGADNTDDDENLGAYFVLKVAAAGWHSAALVLENRELAGKLSAACEVVDPEQETSPSDDELAATTTDFTALLETPVQSAPPHRLDWVLSTISDYSRWFLGLDPHNGSSSMGSRAPKINSWRDNPPPSSYGASPRWGYSYVWAKHHFPRLKLTDGTEMPGKVEFDGWRYGRPEWKLDWDQEDDDES